MFDKPQNHFTFILRFWQERENNIGQGGNWRFSLKDPISGEKRGFATFQELVQFLEAQMDVQDGG